MTWRCETRSITDDWKLHCFYSPPIIILLKTQFCGITYSSQLIIWSHCTINIISKSPAEQWLAKTWNMKAAYFFPSFLCTNTQHLAHIEIHSSWQLVSNFVHQMQSEFFLSRFSLHDLGHMFDIIWENKNNESTVWALLDTEKKFGSLNYFWEAYFSLSIEAKSSIINVNTWEGRGKPWWLPW